MNYKYEIKIRVWVECTTTWQSTQFIITEWQLKGDHNVVVKYDGVCGL